MKRIVVVNPKGGSGKTTLATNIAGYYAASGQRTTLMDYDNQGSSSFWLERRDPTLPAIDSIPAYRHVHGVTRSWYLRVPPDTERVVVDTPAGLDISRFRQQLVEADAIIVPVLPCEIDIHAIANWLPHLLRALEDCTTRRIGIVANRARKRTRAGQKLQEFLAELALPCITTLRDTQHFVTSADSGASIFETDCPGGSGDAEDFEPILDWVEERPRRALRSHVG